jgi:hypothetical protein
MSTQITSNTDKMVNRLAPDNSQRITSYTSSIHPKNTPRAASMRRKKETVGKGAA